MPTFYVRGPHTSFGFSGKEFPVTSGKVVLPDGEVWYTDMVGVILFANPDDIPAEPLPAPAPREGLFLDASDSPAEPEPDVPFGLLSQPESAPAPAPEPPTAPDAPDAPAAKPRAKRK